MEEKTIPAEVPYSPKKVQCCSVQTTPFQQITGTLTPSPEPMVTNNAGTNTEPDPPPVPSVRSIYKAETVKLIRQDIIQQPLNNSASDESCSEEEEEAPLAVAPKKLDRRVLMDRFKSTIENALTQRMRMLGMDVRKKALPSGTFRQLSEKLKSNRQPEYLETRRQFESQLKERLNGSANKPRPLLSLTLRKTPKAANKEPVPRAPVPTPRLRSQPPPSSLMARDGEASSVVSDVKHVALSLIHI